MDFVFINPSEVATRFFPLFERTLTFGVKLTEDFVPQYDTSIVTDIPLLDEGFNGGFDSIAWDRDGVQLQQAKKYPKFKLEDYQDKEVPNGVILIDMICHHRIYAVTSQWIREDNKWSLQRNADVNDDKDNYKKRAIEEIEARHLHGTVQTYLYPDGTVKFKMHPIDMAYMVSKNIVSRHWISIYPTLVAQRHNEAVSTAIFNNWIEKTAI